jgi:hypothetical protein
MDPDVERAVVDLRDRGILPSGRAAYFLRIHQGRLVSVRPELQLLLYGGVLVIASGIGLLVKENFDRIGPVAVAVALGAAVIGCFAWVARAAPPFDWGEVPSPNLAFDYVLLLGVLLGGSELAFLESQFAPLGPNWPWHLLLMAIFATAVAFRFDSRTVFSFALGSYAAWRGVSSGQVERVLWAGMPEAVRLNALGCGLVFVAVGALLARSGRKAHFGPVARHLGWLLFFAAALTGAEGRGARAFGFAALALAAGGALAWRSHRRGDFPFFAYGVLAAYLAVGALVVALQRDVVVSLWWFLLSGVAAALWLWKVHERMREPL